LTKKSSINARRDDQLFTLNASPEERGLVHPIAIDRMPQLAGGMAL
jgi:hypothetical protein